MSPYAEVNAPAFYWFNLGVYQPIDTELNGDKIKSTKRIAYNKKLAVECAREKVVAYGNGYISDGLLDNPALAAKTWREFNTVNYQCASSHTDEQIVKLIRKNRDAMKNIPLGAVLVINVPGPVGILGIAVVDKVYNCRPEDNSDLTRAFPGYSSQLGVRFIHDCGPYIANNEPLCVRIPDWAELNKILIPQNAVQELPFSVYRRILELFI
jgi:hypothetical protein